MVNARYISAYYLCVTHSNINIMLYHTVYLQLKGPPGIEGLDGKDGKPGLRVSYAHASHGWHAHTQAECPNAY